MTAQQSSPARKAAFNPPLAGRGPEPVNLFSVNFETAEGKRVGRGGQMASLPPIGYVFVDGAKRVRGTAGWVGKRYRVVGGEFTDPAASSTRCVTQATVLVTEI